MKRLALVSTLGGCQVLFPLTPSDGPIDAPPGDRDSDGFDDDIDNCPFLTNADQHDEDGDTVGDVCDNCPHVPNGAQEDNGDDDHLGAVCDDTMEIECISLFESFSQPFDPDLLTTIGTWTVIGDVIYQNALLRDGFLMVSPRAFVKPLIVTAAIVRELVPPTTDFSNHGLWFWSGDAFAGNGSPDVGVQAEITSTKTLTPPFTTAALHLSDPPDAMSPHELLVPDKNLVVGSRTQLRLDLRAPGASSSSTFEGSMRMVTYATAIETGRVGLRAHQQGVEFEYVLVIERQPGGCPLRPPGSGAE